MQAPRVPTPAEIARSNELKTTFMANIQDAMMDKNIKRAGDTLLDYIFNNAVPKEDRISSIVYTIQLAIALNFPEIIRYIEHDWREICNYEDSEGYSPVMRAVEAGNLAMVIEIIKQLRGINTLQVFQINRNKYGLTVLDLARKLKNEEIVRHIEDSIRRYKQEQFLYSIQTSNIEDVRRHIMSGIDINGTGANERTPLFEACYNGRWEVVKLLLEHRANPFLGSTWATPLQQIRGQNPEIERLLEERIEELNRLSAASGRPAGPRDPAGPSGPAGRGGNRKSARKTRRQRRR